MKPMGKSMLAAPSTCHEEKASTSVLYGRRITQIRNSKRASTKATN